jgi:hypothetical protein
LLDGGAVARGWRDRRRGRAWEQGPSAWRGQRACVGKGACVGCIGAERRRTTTAWLHTQVQQRAARQRQVSSGTFVLAGGWVEGWRGVGAIFAGRAVPPPGHSEGGDAKARNIR